MASPKKTKLIQASAIATQRKNKKKRIIVTVVIAAVALLMIAAVLVVFFMGNDDYRGLSADRKTVAKCNGEKVPYEELYYITSTCKEELAYQYGEDIWNDPAVAETYREELETLVENRLIENYLILAACKNFEIDTSSDELEAYVDQQIETQIAQQCGGDKDAFITMLGERYMTEHYYRTYLGLVYLYNYPIYDRMAADKLFAYDYSNIDEFESYVMESGNYARTYQFVINNEEGEDPAENLEKAQMVCDSLRDCISANARLELLKDYIGSGMTIGLDEEGKPIKILNDDISDAGGKGYYFGKGEYDEIYENAAFALEIGEVSDPIAYLNGYYVLLRMDLDADQVHSKAQAFLKNYHGAEIARYLEQFRDECVIEYTDYGEQLDLLNLER